MKFALENKLDLIARYTVQQESIHQIAAHYGTYPNKVLRALNFLKVQIRNKSESTKIALKTGRKTHPTEGTNRSADEKLKISEGRAKAWDNLTEIQKEGISIGARTRWDAMSDEKKVEMRTLSNEAIRLTSKEGSSLEKYLHLELVKAGYDCYHHQKILENMKLEVDLFIPALKLAIEIDGPAHFLPIWGEENLAHHIKADKQKNALLQSRGCSVIRVQLHKKSMSDKARRDVLAGLLTSIQTVKSSMSSTIIYLEVK